MGCTFVNNQKTYRWFGQYVGDTKLPDGMTQDQLGKCEHAIKVPGVNYEIGVVRQRDNSFTLAYDFWGDGRGGHDGQKLLAKFGDKLCRLQQAYNKQVVTKQARAKGYSVIEKTMSNGGIKLQLIRA
jgi:hypothetical protein